MTTTLKKSFEFIHPIIEKWSFETRSLIIAISGPQGSGKTYLSAKLQKEISQTRPDLKTVVVSIDDLYLTHSDQLKLSGKDRGNPLLKGRGLPGTHDVDFTYKLLTKLINKDTNFKIPTYDKSAFNGEGDRDVESNWIDIQDKPADVVIFEGWFLGFQPIEDRTTMHNKYDNSELLKRFRIEDIYEINTYLDSYIKIWNMFDVGIFFGTDDINNVYEWRIEQEHELIKKKGQGMTDDQVRAFIDRYMVIYELYYEEFLQTGFRRVLKDGNLKIELDAKRNVVDASNF